MLLAELEKRTEGTPANEKIKEAGVLLREIALTINEEKRKQEEVRALSEKFDGWNGPPLTVYSSVLFCQVSSGSGYTVLGVYARNPDSCTGTS